MNYDIPPNKKNLFSLYYFVPVSPAFQFPFTPPTNSSGQEGPHSDLVEHGENIEYEATYQSFIQ